MDYKGKRPANLRLQAVERVVAGDGIEPPTQGFSGISDNVP
jgi:hypothetical protein